MPPKEIEIKFRVESVGKLNRALKAAGFRLATPRTHEMNTLYDQDGQVLRRNGELLRLRKYGSTWVLTHKSKSKTGRHKARVENETRVSDGARTDSILRALGFRPTFRYEKFRAEWTDDIGHVVVDETPIGTFAEVEGLPRWIDRTAQQLGIARSSYITSSYAPLFLEWKREMKSDAREMTFKEVKR
jgi:adenylate cyclase class 2